MGPENSTEERKRVLFVSAYGLPHVGGIEVAVDELATELARRGHDVTHLASAAGGDRRVPDRGYRVLRLPAANPLEARLGVPYPLFSPVLLPTLRREIAAADVVHAHGYLYQGTIASAAIGRRSKTPLVVTEHVGHVPYKSRLLDSLEAGAIATLGRGVLRSAAAVVTYNDRVADQLRELRPGIEPVTILNGVDQSLFRPPESGEREAIRSALGWDERPRALFVGRPVAKKGFPAAVEAIRAQRCAVLAIAGTDSLPPDTPDRVEALGTLSRSRLAEVYRAADVLLSPARGEGFPLSLQEGLASGLPVLFADDPGYAPNLEGIGAGARAIGDGDHLAAALAELLADPAKLARAREDAAGHARSRFSWPRAADAHEALYARVLHG